MKSVKKFKLPWNKIQIIFESIGYGVILTEIKTKKYLYMNNISCNMLGYKWEEIKTMCIYDVHPMESADRITSDYEAHARGEKICSKETPFLRKDRSIFYADIYTIPAVVDGNKCLFALIFDITKEMNTQAKLKEYRKHLEKLVQKRTYKLEKEIKERKKAEKNLDEKNIALREILKQLEIEKEVIRKNIINNITMMILPLVQDFRHLIPGKYNQYLDFLEQHLEHLTSQFGAKITDPQFKLTTREMRICDLIKGGLSSKEIGLLLSISPRTVEGFRTRIRKKLGITNKSVNLANFLQKL